MNDDSFSLSEIVGILTQSGLTVTITQWHVILAEGEKHFKVPADPGVNLKFAIVQLLRFALNEGRIDTSAWDKQPK